MYVDAASVSSRIASCFGSLGVLEPPPDAGAVLLAAGVVAGVIVLGVIGIGVGVVVGSSAGSRCHSE